MPRAKIVRIDGDKLRQAFTKRGLAPKDADRDTGHGNGFFSKCCRQGWMTVAVAAHLKSLYNITEEDWKPEEEITEVDEATEPETKSEEIDYDRIEQMLNNHLEAMEKVIYRATYAAVKQAWMDE